jgi:hypothetical protein
MTSLKVLSAAAAVALVLPLATPSFAQGRGGHGGFGGAHFGGGGAHIGGGGAHFGGGSFGGGAAMRPMASTAPSVGASRSFYGRAPVPVTGAAVASGGTRSFAAAGSTWNGGRWSGGGWRHHRGGGFWPGFAAGAAIGGLGSYAYYGGPYYGDPYYYGDDYYYDDSPTVAVVPDTGGDSAAYCAQRYRSYDPASGTYLGYDGLRHPCP